MRGRVLSKEVYNRIMIVYGLKEVVYLRKFLSSSFGMFKSEKIFISNHKYTAIGRHPQGGYSLEF